jgi:hypothetical protein
MDQNYIINEQQLTTQHHLVQQQQQQLVQQQLVQQQQLVHQPQQQGSLPLQCHPIQHSGCSTIPAQHTTYSAPSLMNVQPIQPNPSVKIIQQQKITSEKKTIRRRIRSRQRNCNQVYLADNQKEEEKQFNFGKQNPTHRIQLQ